jgi:hypothetical protein
MVGALLMVWGIALVVAIIVFLDWWGRRRERRAIERHSKPW